MKSLLLVLLVLGCGSVPMVPDPMDGDRCPTSLGVDARRACLCGVAERDQNKATWSLYDCDEVLKARRP